MIDDHENSDDGNAHDRTGAGWNRATILRRLEAVLDPAEYRQLVQRLNGSPDEQEAAQDAAWLAHIVAAAETLPLPALPPELSIRLRTLFPPQPPQRHFDAVLTNDSRIERELVGVRGGPDSDGWTLTFDTELGDLLVDLWCNGESHDIEAQLMSTARHADFSLTLSGPSDFAERSDRLGRAAIDHVPSGSYVLMIVRPDIQITAQLEVPTP